MNKVVFLDRDGIINREMGTYVFSMNEFILNDGLEKALTHWKRLGYSFAIVTNQGGISKQIYGHKDVTIINDYLLNWFNSHDLNLLTIAYCPHHDALESCICRKPDSLMLEKIIARFNVSLKDSFLLGDSQRDVDAAHKVGLQGFLVKANSNLNDLNLPYG